MLVLKLVTGALYLKEWGFIYGIIAFLSFVAIAMIKNENQIIASDQILYIVLKM